MAVVYDGTINPMVFQVAVANDTPIVLYPGERSYIIRRLAGWTKTLAASNLEFIQISTSTGMFLVLAPVNPVIPAATASQSAFDTSPNVFVPRGTYLLGATSGITAGDVVYIMGSIEVLSKEPANPYVEVIG